MRIILFITLSVVSIIFTACSYFTFNATMCDQIASDPNAVMPDECRVYNEEEADKSFHNLHKKRMESNETIEFTNEK